VCEFIDFLIPFKFILTFLDKITLYQFRNYAADSYSLQHKVTCITGANGSGKTNLLDAVYHLCYTKSYFSSGVQATIMHDTDGFRLEGSFRRQDRSDVVICRYKNQKKELSRNGVEYDKLSDHIGAYTAVMIAPDDIEMINEGGEFRRKFADSILGQCDKAYLEALLQYQRVLLQRNAWLKLNTQTIGQDQLRYYDNELNRTGQYIFEARQRFLAAFLPLLQQYYQMLSGAREQADIRYESDLLHMPLLQWLERDLRHDLRYQRTLRGIHKDDLIFLLDRRPVKGFGSQGQKKSFLFSLKLAQYAYIRQQLGGSPILLLDDIFEKLDQQRMESLLQIISSDLFGQVLLTDTHEARVQDAFGSISDIGHIRL
jgi:DNA replication and repair protein RecF